MSGLAKWLRARLRNAWAWPGVFQIGCWWERRYRPERWQGGTEGVILLSSGRAPTVGGRNCRGRLPS